MRTLLKRARCERLFFFHIRYTSVGKNPAGVFLCVFLSSTGFLGNHFADNRFRRKRAGINGAESTNPLLHNGLIPGAKRREDIFCGGFEKNIYIFFKFSQKMSCGGGTFVIYSDLAEAPEWRIARKHGHSRDSSWRTEAAEPVFRQNKFFIFLRRSSV